MGGSQNAKNQGFTNQPVPPNQRNISFPAWPIDPSKKFPVKKVPGRKRERPRNQRFAASATQPAKRLLTNITHWSVTKKIAKTNSWAEAETPKESGFTSQCHPASRTSPIHRGLLNRKKFPRQKISWAETKASKASTFPCQCHTARQESHIQLSFLLRKKISS